ncbi:MAG: hypothetical protein R6U65_03695 [Perlabentimonas sp.]
MKKIFTLLVPMILGILITTSVFAQVPEKMSYQAVIRDADGQLVTDTKVGVRVRIQKFIIGMPPSWDDVYVETHNVNKTNENGLLTLMVGTGEILVGTFADIDWSYGNYRLKTEMDPEGGTNYNSITGFSPLLSVPYALEAKNVKTYEVGDFAQGGIVFWVDETGQHGLVAAKEDQNDDIAIQWYNGDYTDTEAHGDGVYAGEMNTMLIISNQGSNSNDFAAGVCANYSVTESGVTYGDWYLPSKEELNLMCLNKATIDAIAGANGGSGFHTLYYWSSTESSSNYVWSQSFRTFDPGYQATSDKSATNRGVRAVRAF